MPAQRNALGLPIHTPPALKGRPKSLDSSHTCDNKRPVRDFVNFAALCEKHSDISALCGLRAHVPRMRGQREIYSDLPRRGYANEDTKKAFSCAPKGQPMPAQRNALGLPSHPHPQALKGRPKPAPVGEEVKGKRLEAILRSEDRSVEKTNDLSD
jgi:hypothetical protein